MNVFIRKCRSFYRILRKPLDWKKDAKALRYNLSSQVKLWNPNEKIMVLIPHADDEWVACSQILMHNMNTTLLYNMDMPGGDTPELHQVRFKELSAVADYCALPLVNVRGCEDDKISILAEKILSERPDSIAAPFYCDWHTDHLNVLKMLKEALLLVKAHNEGAADKLSILLYQVSVPIPSDRITDCCTMTRSQQSEKWKIMDKYYVTQKRIPWVRFGWNEHISGGLCGAYAAEVFVRMKVTDFISELEAHPLSEEHKKMLYGDIQNLRKIRNTVDAVMKEFS